MATSSKLPPNKPKAKKKGRVAFTEVVDSTFDQAEFDSNIGHHYDSKNEVRR
jgi:hypothetical protein